MGFIFATCEPVRALQFINRMYPDRKDLTAKDIPLLYALIKRDVLRVQDPDFHQPCQIVVGNNYTQNHKTEISMAIDEFIVKLAAVNKTTI